MPKPPIQKATQSDYVQFKVRMRPDLYEMLKSSAEFNGRSLNAEILARLQTNELEEIRTQAGEIKSMLRMLLDRT